ncbi:MAG TPA: 3-keto-5-aminohexanoate cleavage protein [Rubrobacteraceae bacterium]|nr:3-keto-5-aminohexanoate cleavage protein [Rubrobacteraceae bacterium]
MIISAAITGGMTVPGQSAAIPVTPDEIVESAVEAHAAGATIVHIHVREPYTGKPSSDLELFREVVSGIKERCDVIVQPTTGGGKGMTLEERAAVLPGLQPEMATFNTGSFNFGLFPIAERGGGDRFEEWEVDYLEGTRDYIFRNTFADMEKVCGMFREAGAKPELEAYDVGHLYNIKYLLDKGLLDTPIHLQFVLGVLGANAATIEQFMHMRRTATDLFGSGYTFSAAGVGYPAEYHLAAMCLMLGGHVRVGLEDNLRVRRDKRTDSNAELVEKAVALAAMFDREPATPDEAREAFGLKGRAAVAF